MDPGPSAHYIYGEIVSFSAMLGAFMDFLPKIAAGVAVLWYIILIIESRTAISVWARLKIRQDAHRARELIRADAQSAQVDIKIRAIEAAEAVEKAADKRKREMFND